MADGRCILSLPSLAAECGTMLTLEAADAVAALANLMSETDGSPKIPEIQGHVFGVHEVGNPHPDLAWSLEVDGHESFVGLIAPDLSLGQELVDV